MSAVFTPLETNVGSVSMNGLTEVELCRVDVTSGDVTTTLLPEIWAAAITDNFKKLLPYTAVTERYTPEFVRLLAQVVQASGKYTAVLEPSRDHDTLELVLTLKALTAVDTILVQIPTSAEAGFNIYPEPGAAGVAPEALSEYLKAVDAASTYAPKVHNHDAAYAAKVHGHTEYATASHTHATYAPVTHTHTEYATTTALTSGLAGKADVSHAHAYAPLVHTHDYASSAHTHTEYAAASHGHTEYATATHTHTQYAALSHSHSEYADKVHTHDYVTTTELNDAISGLGDGTPSDAVTTPQLNTALLDYATKTYVDSGLLGKASSSHLHSQYALATDLDALELRVDGLDTGGSGGGTATIPSEVITETELTTALDGYYTKDQVNTDFATQAALTALQTTVSGLTTTPGTDAAVLTRLDGIDAALASLTAPPALNPADYVLDTELTAALGEYVTTASLGTYLIESDADLKYATKTELAALAESLGATGSIDEGTFATKDELAAYLKLTDTRATTAGDLAVTTDLDGYYTKDEVDDAVDALETSLAGKADASALAAKVDTTTLTTNYYTQAQTNTAISTAISGLSGGGGGTATDISLKTRTIGPIGDEASTGVYYVTLSGRGATLDAITATRNTAVEGSTAFGISVANTYNTGLEHVTIATYTRKETRAGITVVLDNPQGAVLAHELVRVLATAVPVLGTPSVSPNVHVANSSGDALVTNGINNQVDPTATYPKLRVTATGYGKATDNSTTDGSYNKVQYLSIRF